MNEKNDWAVRLAQAPDLETVSSLESYWPFAPHWSKPQLKEELSRPDSLFLTAELSFPKDIGGYLIGRVSEKEFQILSVSVGPRYLRRGIAAGLLEQALSSARLKGCARASLEVSERNLSALSLYQKLGFQIVGKRAKFYNDGSSALLMDKLL